MAVVAAARSLTGQAPTPRGASPYKVSSESQQNVLSQTISWATRVTHCHRHRFSAIKMRGISKLVVQADKSLPTRLSCALSHDRREFGASPFDLCEMLTSPFVLHLTLGTLPLSLHQHSEVTSQLVHRCPLLVRVGISEEAKQVYLMVNNLKPSSCHKLKTGALDLHTSTIKRLICATHCVRTVSYYGNNLYYHTP